MRCSQFALVACLAGVFLSLALPVGAQEPVSGLTVKINSITRLHYVGDQPKSGDDFIQVNFSVTSTTGGAAPKSVEISYTTTVETTVEVPGEKPKTTVDNSFSLGDDTPTAQKLPGSGDKTYLGQATGETNVSDKVIQDEFRDIRVDHVKQGDGSFLTKKPMMPVVVHVVVTGTDSTGVTASDSANVDLGKITVRQVFPPKKK